nr:alpha-galactosidase [bacterium]
MQLNAGAFKICFSANDTCLFTYESLGNPVRVSAPVCELDGAPFCWQPVAEPRITNHQQLDGEQVYTLAAPCADGKTLGMELAWREGSPMLRVAYTLMGEGCMTKSGGTDLLRYAAFDAAAFPCLTQVAFGSYNGILHSYECVEKPVDWADRAMDIPLEGPILLAEGQDASLLMAYELGELGTPPYVAFTTKDTICLQAVHGNYARGRALPYTTIAYLMGMAPGKKAAAADMLRQYLLAGARSTNPEALITYNTWNYQERNFWWNHQGFETDMTPKRMLAEIDIAHRMGIDGFILDDGWQRIRGDWRPDEGRFPDGLGQVQSSLADKGMRMGLWFVPQLCQDSIVKANGMEAMIKTENGQPMRRRWVKDNNNMMCLAGGYASFFAQRCVELYQQYGVTIFKWDGVGLGGCDSPYHSHGDQSVPAQERSDVSAFEEARALLDMAREVRQRVPGALIDFDTTEDGRFIGLGFLRYGRIFLVNNGPYLQDYDLPDDGTVWTNVFTHPGPARANICRAPLPMDRYIPSTQILTHYLPDGPENSILINMASLMLGQNGIWGDLLALQGSEISLVADLLAAYKSVRADMEKAAPVLSGHIGGSPEIHEKIHAGRGGIIAFSSVPGTYRYATRHEVSRHTTIFGNAKVQHSPNGHAAIEVTFDAPGACVVLFQ